MSSPPPPTLYEDVAKQIVADFSVFTAGMVRTNRLLRSANSAATRHWSRSTPPPTSSSSNSTRTSPELASLFWATTVSDDDFDLFWCCRCCGLFSFIFVRSLAVAPERVEAWLQKEQFQVRVDRNPVGSVFLAPFASCCQEGKWIVFVTAQRICGSRLYLTPPRRLCIYNL